MTFQSNIKHFFLAKDLKTSKEIKKVDPCIWWSSNNTEMFTIYTPGMHRNSNALLTPSVWQT